MALVLVEDHRLSSKTLKYPVYEVPEECRGGSSKLILQKGSGNWTFLEELVGSLPGMRRWMCIPDMGKRMIETLT